MERTNVLQTTFQTTTGEATVTDFMPVIESESAEQPNFRALYRQVTCTDGAVDLDVSFRPRFDYASAEMTSSRLQSSSLPVRTVECSCRVRSNFVPRLSQTSTYCEQYDLSFETESIRTFDPDQTTQYGLTPPQYEALTLACERGYFAVPREIDLEGLAEEIGVSHQALSERLRRGHQTLIKTVLGGPGTPLTAAPAAEQSLDDER
jgi:predicted DNA binding protein